MTSARKIAANVSNAKASTGPRTVEGKARAAQNARRHGLSAPLRSDAFLWAKAENLTFEIAGEGGNSEVLSLARLVAESQIDVQRIRAARQHLLRARLGSDVNSFIRELAAVDRYERRALSRRKFAIRALDAALYRKRCP